MKDMLTDAKGSAALAGYVVAPLDMSLEGFQLSITNEDIDPEWNSGWFSIASLGDFSIQATIDPNRAVSEFRVVIRVTAGRALTLVPSYFVLSGSKRM